MRWVTAQDLQSWADRLDCQSTLPELVRRLIHATCEKPDRVAFPSGESVQTGGWDGIVSTPAGTEYVPDGWSGWELSKRGDIKTKADDDYDKRTTNPESLDRDKTAFIFITPRRWNAKEAWAKEKAATGAWYDVRAYDADDLEQWLEQAPAVGAWLARILHKYPEGVWSIDDYWMEYALATKPTFTPAILLAGRDTNAKEANEWLQQGTGTLFVTADSPPEAIAVIATSITRLPDEEQQHLRSRFLLAENATVLRELITTAQQLIIGWLATDASSIGLAIHRGHRVILPTRDHHHGEALNISRPDADALLKALIAAGLPEDRAKKVLKDASGSITVLHRQLDQAPVPPAWAQPAVAHDLIPALLANAWDEHAPRFPEAGATEESRVPDQTLLGQLGGTEYSTISAAMARWSNVPDAPVQQVGTVWTIRAPRDAWLLLHAYLTKNDLDRYKAAVTAAFGIDDPSLDLPPEERWLANIKGKEFPHSLWLRRGLAQSLTLISLTPTIAGYRGADIAASITHDLLDANWQRWYTLEPILPHLAEAAPTIFLEALEAIVARDAQGIDHLFENQGPMHGDHSTGLLWALELLAWYPEHLTRTSILLAKLGRQHKRPKEILRAIFLTWLPQTGASVTQRNAALTVLLKQEPAVAWEVIMALWPQTFDSGSYHYEPQWREKPTRPVTVGDRITATLGIIDLAMQAAENNPDRLCDLITSMGTAPPAARQQLRDRLAAFPQNDTAGRLRLLETLRKHLNHHRHFHTADWALPEEELAPFDAVITLLMPDDPVLRHAWLFQDVYPMLPLPDANYTTIDTALVQQRTQAISEITVAKGVAGVAELARLVQHPHLVGMTCATAILDDDTMLGFLTSDEDPLRICAMGYASEQYGKRGLAWVDQVLTTQDHWPPLTRAFFLLAIPSERPAWDRAAAYGAEHEYWRRTRVFLRHEATTEDITYALNHLLAANQLPQAFQQASMAAPQVPTAILTQVLDSILQALQQPDYPHDYLEPYHIVQIFGALDHRDDIDTGTIARYEWAFLPLLRDRRPLRLHEHLASAPDLFAQMIAGIYRPHNEEPRQEPTKENIARAHQAYELLNSWHTIPGAKPDGSIDQEALIKWVDEARAACEQRREVCDIHIGHVLATSPAGVDGVWPHESIRALIEHVNSSSLEDGFRTGIISSRGVYTKDPLGGGMQERGLAAKYRAWADQLAAANPRTAAALAALAEDYERHAHHEDIRTAQLQVRQ